MYYLQTSMFSDKRNSFFFFFTYYSLIYFFSCGVCKYELHKGLWVYIYELNVLLLHTALLLRVNIHNIKCIMTYVHF